MTISPFVFSSANLPKLKAKQLCKAFPFLKLSVAQEATARALGYASWYSCIQSGTRGEPSEPDQDAGFSVRVHRYYHQAGILTALGITPSDADHWVRSWGLTGRPTMDPREAIPLYYRWEEALQRLARGDMSEDEVMSEWGEADVSKYPDVDRPRRICSGVILGPCGMYPHYAVDPALNAKIPIYLRGPASLYHYEDDSDVLAMTIPGFNGVVDDDNPFHPRLNRLQHEWHHGTKHPSSREPVLPKLIDAALSVPDAMVVISQRAMPRPEDMMDFQHVAVACLRARDFAAFLRAKGVLDSEKVIWYREVDVRDLRLETQYGLMGYEGEVQLPVFANAAKHSPALPLYSYPFMAAPMHADEYSVGRERVCLLPLDEDYDEDTNDGGWDDGDPNAPSTDDPRVSVSKDGYLH